MSEDLFAKQVPFLRPWLGDEEADAVREVIKSGWICLGPKVAELEKRIAALVGAKHGVATTAATTALHLALQCSGLRRDDEVILPSFTCMANANAVIIAGGVCRFADIERRTYNLDPEDVEKRIGPKTRAIMMVDQIGLPADLDRFKEITERGGLILVDDAATALGATYKGKPVGGHGVATCYSFHPRKMITTGEGGMLMTDDDAIAERARQLRSTGASISDLLRHQAKGALFQQYFDAGYNYRMTDMQAAMGLVQLGKLDAIKAQRAAQAKLYDELLAPLDEVVPPFVPSYATNAWSSYCIRLTPKSKVSADDVVKRMAGRNVSCRRGIQPLHHEPYFEEHMKGLVLPETESAAKETLFLPIFPGLREDEQRKVADALKESLPRVSQRELCVILGSGAQGRVILEVWRAARPDADFVFLDDDEKTHDTSVLGANVIGPFARARELGGEVVVALGNNRARLRASRELDGTVRWGNAVHPSAVVSPSAVLGPGTVVFAGAVVNTGAALGAHVVVNTGVILEHDSIIGDAASVSPGATSGGRIVLGEGTFIGTGVTLAPRVKIGAWSVVGAGAVVAADLPERVLAYGVPARVVRPIDDSFDWRRLL